MADSSDTGLLPRTYFKAPRVPFDVRAVVLAVAAYLIFWSGGLALKAIFGQRDVAGAFLATVYGVFRELPYVGGVIGELLTKIFGTDVRSFPLADYSVWHVLAGGIWFFGVWSFFGQGIHRIVSLRIARDEGLSLGEALSFSLKNWPTMLLAPVVVLGVVAIFYLCNVVAGLVISIPVLGTILSLILIPLAALSSLLILLVAVGGVFGLPLVGASAAWERNGVLDALSRAFSYIFARPLQFFWNYFLIFLFLGVVLLVGNWFVYTLVKSVDAGLLDDTPSVLIDAPVRSNAEGSDYVQLGSGDKELYNNLEEATGYRPDGGRAPHAEPFARDFQGVVKAPWLHKLTALSFWFVLNLISWLGIFGYAVYWFLGASTSVYADLRADVDGTEEDEIYLEEEQEEFEALARGGPTVPAPSPGSPGSTPGTPPASGGGSPPAT